ncbi:hypothetical protein ACWCOT_11630 [Nonomuraea bangladeshensis]
MIIWINGTHGAGKTTTSALVQRLIPDSRVFNAEKVGEALMDITPGLPAMGTSSTGHRGGPYVAARRGRGRRHHAPHARPGRPADRGGRQGLSQ